MKTRAAIVIPFLLALAAPVQAQDTLFDDMGGQAGIDKLTDVSVDNYLADPRISAIFDESNLDRLRAEFGSAALEGISGLSVNT